MTTSAPVHNLCSSEQLSDRHQDVLKYRLDVVANTVIDVVRPVGGWLYDRAAAGWEVHVLLPHLGDTRALQILGVHAVDLDEQFARTSTPWPAEGLAISADLFAADPRVRDLAFKALDHRFTEVTFWDGNRPFAIGRRTTAVQHVLSGAARIFKRYALAAAGISDQSVGPTETLLCATGTFATRHADSASQFSQSAGERG